MEELTIDREQTVKSKLRGFIVDNFLFGEDTRFLETDSFIEKGILDSTGILEMIEYIESAFKIDIAESEMVPENLGSLANLSRFIGRKREAN